jgi:type I restriction enzyme S subunit
MQLSALGDVADFINGAAFKPTDWEEEGRRIIRIQNLNDPRKPFNRTTREVPAKYEVHPGTLLVSWSASLGVFEWQEEDTALLNQHIFKVVPNERRVSQEYLRHMLERALVDMSRHHRGSTMVHVNRGEFLGTKIPLPPLAEQRRIAAILDKADGLRRKRREALALLDTLTQSIFVEMFGDPVSNSKGLNRVPFDTVLSDIQSGWSPTCLDRPARDGEWSVLKLSAITSGRFSDEENKAMTADNEERPCLEVQIGDVLFSRKNTRELVAACAYVWDTEPRRMIPDLIFRFRIKEEAQLLPTYLWALLSNPKKRRSVQKLAGGSAGSMPNISKSKLRALEIELPSMDEQRTFEQAARRLQDHSQRSVSLLEFADTLFASLQSRAFNGTL